MGKIDLEELVRAIFEYDSDAGNIHHLMAVHGYCKLIAEMEKLDEKTIYVVELAAFLHDIGVKISKEKFGNSSPIHQMEEGPIVAKELLRKFGVDEDVLERVCFLIAHHHDYKAIDGVDFQILIEADYIVNLMEGYCKRESIGEMKKLFRTKSGLFILDKMFGE